MVVRIINKLIYLFLMVYSTLATAKFSQDFVVSAGLFRPHDSFESFYNSPIFVGHQKPEFVIKNTSFPVYFYKNTYFFSMNGLLSKEEILSWKKHEQEKTGSALIGHSYFGFTLGKNLSDGVQRSLGAPKGDAHFSVLKIDSKTLYAISFNDKLSWPQKAQDLKEVPAVMIEDNVGAEAVMIARPVGTVSSKLALVDELLAKKNEALYLEIGINEYEAASSLNEALIEEVAKRKGLVFPGASDLLSIKNHREKYASLGLVSPFGQAHRSLIAGLSKTRINFWSLTNNEDFWAFYQQKVFGAAETVKSGIERMVALEKNPERSLNIVRVFSQKAALEAAKSVYVDLVLFVLPEINSQLPSSEVIDLKHAASDSFEQIAPIILLSPLEISELTIMGAAAGSINQVSVKRHGLKEVALSKAESPEKPFALRKQEVLPALVKAWEQAELNSIIGGLMLKESKADVAIFENEHAITPVKGSLSHDYLLSRFKRPGRMVVLQTNGRQLKKIAKLIRENKFAANYAVFGFDPKGSSIRERPLSDNENFRLALTNKALLEIFGLSSMGAMDQELSVRAPFIESIYGRLDNLLFLNSTKTMMSLENSKSVEEALDRTITLPSFASVMEESLASLSEKEWREYVGKPYGTPRHSLIFDIEYLDVGFSKNVANHMYVYHLQPDNPSLPMSRGSADTFAHLLIFSKIALTYDAPGLITKLTNGIRFLTVSGFDSKPSKDKITFGLDFRLPWERSFFKDKAVVISPIWTNLYETKIAPIAFLSDKTEADWKKDKMSPRPKKLDSLLGLNFDFKRLGFQVDVGGMLSTDFNQNTVHDALDIGPGLNFTSKWNLFGPFELSSVIKSSYLFGLPNNEAVGKAALSIEGTAWLRVARFYDFSLSLMSDFLFATLQEKPKNMAASSIFGFTISYGKLMRIFG